MEYVFEGKFLVDESGSFFTIPFNVWEVCEDNVGEIPVHVIADGHKYDCKLEPLKNGYYLIPVDKAILDNFENNSLYPVSFTIIGKETAERESSPYSIENPIRKIDGIDNLIQPWDGLCGQTVFAMLAGVSIEEAENIMHCREWQANMAKIVPSLDYVGIRHSEQIIYTQGKEVTLPKCCIIMENLGRFSHYLVGFNGNYYDPNNGISDSIEVENIKGYLEIYCD